MKVESDGKEKKVDLLKQNLQRIKHKIIVISGKGGVGKSTVSVNLSYGLALAGKKVGILDADIHGPNIPKMLGIEDKVISYNDKTKNPVPIKVVENIYSLSLANLSKNPDDPIVWRGPLKMKLIQQFLQDIEWPELDYLIIDCPPGTGDEPLSVVQIIKDVSGSVIVSTPQDIAFLDSRKAIKFSKQLNVPVLGIVENMSSFKCPHCQKEINLFVGTGAKKAAKDFSVDILGSIPIDPDIVKSGDNGKPYIYHFSKTQAGKIMIDIVDKIISKIEK